MDEERTSNEKIVEVVGRLVETYRDLLTINAVQRASLGASWSVVGIIILVLSLLMLLFAGLGLAWWLGEQLNNMKAGFFIIGGSYLVLFLVILLTARTFIVPPLRDLFIRKFYDENN